MAESRIVIVADDDVDIRESLAEIFRDEGLDVRLAKHGRAALDLLETLGDEQCVLLLDLAMPVLSGFDVLDTLSRSERLPALPVIVCSASRGRGALPSGVRHWFQKPVDLAELLPVLDEACRERTSEVRLCSAAKDDVLAEHESGTPSILDAACDLLESDEHLAIAGAPHDARTLRLAHAHEVLRAWTEGTMTADAAERELRAEVRASQFRRGSG